LKNTNVKFVDADEEESEEGKRCSDPAPGEETVTK